MLAKKTFTKAGAIHMPKRIRTKWLEAIWNELYREAEIAVACVTQSLSSSEY